MGDWEAQVSSGPGGTRRWLNGRLEGPISAAGLKIEIHHTMYSLGSFFSLKNLNSGTGLIRLALESTRENRRLKMYMYVSRICEREEEVVEFEGYQMACRARFWIFGTHSRSSWTDKGQGTKKKTNTKHMFIPRCLYPDSQRPTNEPTPPPPLSCPTHAVYR